jgi:hypothetical protein
MENITEQLFGEEIKEMPESQPRLSINSINERAIF